jgi:ribosomal protein S9
MSGGGYAGQPPNALTLAIERAVQNIERELHHHLDPVERIAIERVLEQLADDVPNRRRIEPWC